jgi:hypothetical protein
MIFWMGSYLTGRIKRIWVGDYSSKTIHCHSGVPQGSPLGLLIFIADIDVMLAIFESIRIHHAYADDLNLYMRVRSVCKVVDVRKSMT